MQHSWYAYIYISVMFTSILYKTEWTKNKAETSVLLRKKFPLLDLQYKRLDVAAGEGKDGNTDKWDRRVAAVRL